MTVEYEDGKPDHLERVLVSCLIDLLFHQHLDIIPKVHFTRTGGEM